MIGGRSALLSAAGGGSPYGNWTGNYENVSLLLRNGAPMGPLVPVDESPRPKDLTALGDAGISTAIKQYGASSMVFDGSGDHFRSPLNADFDFGTGDFTIECWINLNTLATDQAFVVYAETVTASGTSFALDRAGGAFRCYIYSGTTLYIATVNPVISTGTWYHVAGVRSGGQLRCYVNGVGGTAVNANASVNAPTGRALAVGSFLTSLRFTNGYIDDLRITKGVARYTANFTPPTVELPANITDDPSYNNVSLLLRNGAPTLFPVDESPTPKTITGTGNASISTTVFKYGTSSLMLDGNGDWFETNATTDFDFANNPFTIEAWVYAITLNHTASPAIFSNMNNGGDGTISGYVLGVTSTGGLFFNDYNSSAIPISLISPAGAITTGQWYHVAICKAGTDTNQVKLFVNGQIVISGTRNANIPVAVSGLPGRIGAWRYATVQRPWNGYIDDLRITKGVARYTKNFLPPPAELPAI